MKQLFCIYLLLIIIYSSCSTSRQNSTPINETIVMNALPNVFIYKTRKDYSKNVPVSLNADKTQIISYPAPSDLCPDGICFYPTQLADGFLLDNKGIGKNVAFLSYTYEEYASFASAPDINDLLNNIIDKDPLIELYDCGKRKDYKNLSKELNNLVTSREYKAKKNLLIK